MNASLPYGPPVKTDIDNYQTFILLFRLFFFFFFVRLAVLETEVQNMFIVFIILSTQSTCI